MDFLNTDAKFRTGILDEVSSGKNEDEVELDMDFKRHLVKFSIRVFNELELIDRNYRQHERR
jgi:hypothetical protein